MSTKTRLQKAEKATRNKAGAGQPVTEIIIYGTDESGETRLLETIQTGTRVYLPDNGRGDKPKAGQP